MYKIDLCIHYIVYVKQHQPVETLCYQINENQNRDGPH
jgi:hypothetical protein